MTWDGRFGTQRHVMMELIMGCMVMGTTDWLGGHGNRSKQMHGTRIGHFQ